MTVVPAKGPAPDMDAFSMVRGSLGLAQGITPAHAATVFLVVACALYFLARFPATKAIAVSQMPRIARMGALVTGCATGLLATIPASYQMAVGAIILVGCAPSIVRWLVSGPGPGLTRQGRKG